MPLLRVNATVDGLNLHETPGTVSLRLSALASCPGPAIIMIHGYKYMPGSAEHCPHRKLFGLKSDDWPNRLGFGRHSKNEGLGIALGWQARGPLWKMHQHARHMGKRLADVVSILRAQTPLRPVHVVAHSLGTELALSALEHLPKGSIDRMILLSGASYTSHAWAMLQTPAGRSTETLNITSRENDVFDAAFERLIPSDHPNDRAVGHGVEISNAVNVQLDCRPTLRNLEILGYRVAPPERRICHWSTYTRKGTMALYSDFLREPQALPLSRVAQACPEIAQPRWSRLFPLQGFLRQFTPSGLPVPQHTLSCAPSDEKTAA